MLLENLIEKYKDLKQHNEDIATLLPDEEIENEAIANDEIDMNIKRAIEKIRKDWTHQRYKVSNISETKSKTTQGINLSKFNLIRFNGDPFKWVSI